VVHKNIRFGNFRGMVQDIQPHGIHLIVIPLAVIAGKQQFPARSGLNKLDPRHNPVFQNPGKPGPPDLGPQDKYRGFVRYILKFGIHILFSAFDHTHIDQKRRQARRRDYQKANPYKFFSFTHFFTRTYFEYKPETTRRPCGTIGFGNNRHRLVYQIERGKETIFLYRGKGKSSYPGILPIDHNSRFLYTKNLLI
jgi:hypothetical protein